MTKKQSNTTQSRMYKYILNRSDLLAWDKLTYIIINENQPCDYPTLCGQLNLPIESVERLVEKLISVNLIVESKISKGLFYPAFALTNGGEKKKEKIQHEKTTITDKDRDLLLIVKVVEEFYKQRGVTYKLSKKGRKHLTHTVSYLNKVWDSRKDNKEIGDLLSKEELYKSYISFTFKNLDDTELKHVKKLKYAANKSAWRSHLKNTFISFKPILLEDCASSEKFMGVLKREIPQNPKTKGYWTTVDTFLLKKWSTDTYPVCKQVLYALERVIVAHLYRFHKQTAKDLIRIHQMYSEKYKVAEARGKLDNLIEYVNEDKKRSDYCHDCTQKNDCKLSRTKDTVIVTCQSKTTK